MQSVVIELDEKLVAEIDVAAKSFNQDRLQYINESLRKSLRNDFRKRKFTEEEVSKMYEDAYTKFPIQPDEFEIEDEQMERFWEQV